MAQSTQFRFAPFRLDPSRVVLWRDAEEVALPPKVFDLPCYLVQHAEELVTKDQLLDAVTRVSDGRGRDRQDDSD